MTNCVTITTDDGGLPWILRDASAGQHGRSPLVRALLLLLRDDEAVGSNPATPTVKHQLRGCVRLSAMASGDQQRDYRILFRWCIPAVEVLSAVHDGDRLPVAASGTETRPTTMMRSLQR